MIASYAAQGSSQVPTDASAAEEVPGMLLQFSCSKTVTSQEEDVKRGLGQLLQARLDT